MSPKLQKVVIAGRPSCYKVNGRGTYFCDTSFGLVVCFLPPSKAFMLDVGFVAGLPAPFGCALREVPEAGFAFEAILVVEAIAELSVKMARCGTVAQKLMV